MLKKYLEYAPPSLEKNELLYKLSLVEKHVLRTGGGYSFDQNYSEYLNFHINDGSKATIVFREDIPGLDKLVCRNVFTKAIQSALDLYQEVAKQPQCQANDALNLFTSNLFLKPKGPLKFDILYPNKALYRPFPLQPQGPNNEWVLPHNQQGNQKSPYFFDLVKHFLNNPNSSPQRYPFSPTNPTRSPVPVTSSNPWDVLPIRPTYPTYTPQNPLDVWNFQKKPANPFYPDLNVGQPQNPKNPWSFPHNPVNPSNNPSNPFNPDIDILQPQDPTTGWISPQNNFNPSNNPTNPFNPDFKIVQPLNPVDVWNLPNNPVNPTNRPVNPFYPNFNPVQPTNPSDVWNFPINPLNPTSKSINPLYPGFDIMKPKDLLLPSVSSLQSSPKLDVIIKLLGVLGPDQLNKVKNNPLVLSELLQKFIPEGEKDSLYSNLLYPSQSNDNPNLPDKQAILEYLGNLNLVPKPGTPEDKDALDALTNNLQQWFAIPNLYKLPPITNNAGIIELTYMLKRPKPLIYQPVYYVKYRLPYKTFVQNLQNLIQRQPELIAQPAKLYQELLILSNVSQVSPGLTGYNKDQFSKSMLGNGALIDAKLVRGPSDAYVNEQLEVIKNLNSDVDPDAFGLEALTWLNNSDSGFVANSFPINLFGNGAEFNTGGGGYYKVSQSPYDDDTALQINGNFVTRVVPNFLNVDPQFVAAKEVSGGVQFGPVKWFQSSGQSFGPNLMKSEVDFARQAANDWVTEGSNSDLKIKRSI